MDLGCRFLLGACLTVTSLASIAAENVGGYSIVPDRSGFALQAGSLHRQIHIDGNGVFTASLTNGRQQLVARPATETKMRIQVASPDRKPRTLKAGEGGSIDTMGVDAATNILSVSEQRNDTASDVAWVNPPKQNGKTSAGICGKKKSTHWDKDGIHHLTIAGKSCDGLVDVSLNYEVYDGYPATRKWVGVTNPGRHWLKIDHLVLEDWELLAQFRHSTPLTPSERGAVSSLLAVGSADDSSGLILGSEIPSALRNIDSSGSMGYTDEYFEWVLGPKETFTSEPVFEYAYEGATEKTISAVSTALDRAVEMPFQRFLRERIGLKVDAANLPAPAFTTWSNFGPRIDDAIVREMAELASDAGFSIIGLDDGWQKGRLGAEIDPVKFPDFTATTSYARSKGLRVGLWVSTFRSPDSIDLRDLPNGASRPAIRRSGGFGMSFASTWREYYAKTLADVSRRYGITYFKQDFSNIRFGDLAEGHESRTLKESLLRGLRGLLQAQDIIHSEVPGVTLEITHEAYWGTPGVPCDLAVLKHANLYHIPPNDYAGDGIRMERYSPDWKLTPEAMRAGLIQGTLDARGRFYAHRGLPLDSIEFYGAATLNFKGSLTTQIQDRQIASWLMGAPMVFAGDLASLTRENIDHYKSRFALLKKLQDRYNIYDYFEFSGVPSAPADQDWQWWGKLNPDGYGAVVVLRGVGGKDARPINVPWVVADRRYQVRALLGERQLGQFSGSQLQAGAITIPLPTYGQEILEISPAVQ